MKIENVPLAVVDWDNVVEEIILGEQGEARQRLCEAGNIRVRQVAYSAGYLADHWCPRGHVLLVLKGELVLELDDGTQHEMPAGTSFHVDDEGRAHRVYSEKGAIVFIVD